MILIPDKFLKIPYNARRYPGKKGAINALQGANCQLFVYESLRFSGFDVPFDYRSSELWGDKEFTKCVDTLKPYDIVFFNRSCNPYGAHLGIYIGSNKVIHLSKIVGYPAVWDMEEFKKHDRYKCFIGAKRLKQKKV